LIAEAWLLALGLAGTLLFLAGGLHIPITAVTAGIAVVLAVLFQFIPSVARDQRRQPATLIPRSARDKLVATVLTVIPLLALLFAATLIPLRDFDGRAFWLLKAKGIAHDHAIDGPFFHDQLVTDPRNDYPLLLPLDAAAVMLLGHTYDDTVVRWLYVITFIAFVFFVRARLGPWPAVILAWIPQFTVVTDGGALSAYNDIPLAAFLAGAFFELTEAHEATCHPERSEGSVWAGRFGMWLAFCVLTKNEGLPLAVILLLAGAFVYRRRFWPALVPFGVAIAALFTWKHRIPHGSEEDLAALLPTLPRHLDRLPGAIAGMARHLVTPVWGFFWIAVLLALLVLAWQRRREALLPAFVIGGAFTLYIAVYTVTTWVQSDLINSSADRVLMHVVGPGLFVLSRLVRRDPPESPGAGR
jgi:hypothetical protein